MKMQFYVKWLAMNYIAKPDTNAFGISTNMEKIDVRKIIDRISHMQYYKVIIPLEDELEFRGPVPFDIKINKDGLAQFTILAASYDEAEKKAWDYINGEGYTGSAN